MTEVISTVVKKHLFAYGPNRKGCVMYMTEGVRDIADELGVSYKAADEIVHSWINQNMRED